jgi:hypothetical protein
MPDQRQVPPVSPAVEEPERIEAAALLSTRAITAVVDLMKKRGIRISRENVADMLAAAWRAALAGSPSGKETPEP